MNGNIELLKQGIEQGVVTPEEIESLNKAIAAGYGYAGKPQDLTYGGVIQTESLETTLKSVTFDMKNLKFWPAISVDKAFNVFEQYNRLLSYGSDSVPYLSEGGAPQEEDSTYVRDGQKIVFFGTRRKVSHQMTLVRTSVGDVVAQQAKEGTMHLLKNVEREMYWGHAHFINPISGLMSGSDADLPVNSIAMNGLYKQLKKGDFDAIMRSGDFEGYGQFSSIGLDLAGQVIQQDDIERASVIALENFGHPTELHIEPLALSSFIRQFYPQFRSAPGLANQAVGYDVSKVVTSAGTVDFKPNLFLRPRTAVRPKPVNDKCPSIAGATVAAADGGADPSSKFSKALSAVRYAVTFMNDFGESAPIRPVAPIAVAAGHKVNLTVNNIPAGTKYIKVYRSADGGALGSEAFVGNYAVSGSVYVDNNAKMAGLGEAFLLDMSAETMKFKQLSPLSKINFAIVTTAIEFAIVLYGALFLYAPRFNAYFMNVGK